MCVKLHVSIKRTSEPPLHVDASSGSTVQNGSKSNLRGREQKSCICHGCLGQKVVCIFSQRLWVLQHGVSSLEVKKDVTKQYNTMQFQFERCVPGITHLKIDEQTLQGSVGVVDDEVKIELLDEKQLELQDLLQDFLLSCWSLLLKIAHKLGA